MAASVVESLRVALLAMAAVDSLIESDGSRIRPRLPQDLAIPAGGVVIIELDGNDGRTNDLQGRGGLPYHDVNILVRAPQGEDARALAEAIRVNGTDPGTGLAGYSDTPIDVLIDATLASTTGPTEVTRDDGSARPFWDVNMLFEVSHNEVA